MKHFDLNLLRILVALDRTKHVGRAAESLEMSQSGFSSALARLRQRTGDELLVRGAGSMRPTPRALTLIETARAVLSQVEQDVLERGSFDPLQASVSFRLSMSDVAEVLIMPDLIRHLTEHAPLTSVHIASPSVAPLYERLSSGEVDLAIGYFPHLAPRSAAPVRTRSARRQRRWPTCGSRSASVGMRRWRCEMSPRPANKNWPSFRPVNLKYSSIRLPRAMRTRAVCCIVPIYRRRSSILKPSRANGWSYAESDQPHAGIPQATEQATEPSGRKTADIDAVECAGDSVPARWVWTLESSEASSGLSTREACPGPQAP